MYYNWILIWSKYNFEVSFIVNNKFFGFPHFLLLNFSNITQLVTQHLNNNSINIISCEKLPFRNSTGSSFKVAIQHQDVDALHNPAIWPTDVLVKPFKFCKALNGHNQTSYHGRFRQHQGRYHIWLMIIMQFYQSRR